jgi:hypothetical protein
VTKGAAMTSLARLPVLLQTATTARAPLRCETARRALDPIPAPNRKDETMQDTVDRTPPLPRTLAQIIEDARRR